MRSIEGRGPERARRACGPSADDPGRPVAVWGDSSRWSSSRRSSSTSPPSIVATRTTTIHLPRSTAPDGPRRSSIRPVAAPAPLVVSGEILAALWSVLGVVSSLVRSDPSETKESRCPAVTTRTDPRVAAPTACRRRRCERTRELDERRRPRACRATTARRSRDGGGSRWPRPGGWHSSIRSAAPSAPCSACPAPDPLRLAGGDVWVADAPLAAVLRVPLRRQARATASQLDLRASPPPTRTASHVSPRGGRAAGHDHRR